MIPKALEEAFENPETEQERAVTALIDVHTAMKATGIEQMLFEEKTRFNNAEREIAAREAVGK